MLAAASDVSLRGLDERTLPSPYETAHDWQALTISRKYAGFAHALDTGAQYRTLYLVHAGV